MWKPPDRRVLQKDSVLLWKPKKDTLPTLKTKSSGEAEGGRKGCFSKPVIAGRLDTCLSMGAGQSTNGAWEEWGCKGGGDKEEKKKQKRKKREEEAGDGGGQTDVA